MTVPTTFKLNDTAVRIKLVDDRWQAVKLQIDQEEDDGDRMGRRSQAG